MFFLAVTLAPPGEKIVGDAVKLLTCSSDSTQTLGDPLRVVVKATRLPSGLHVGSVSTYVF